MKNHLDSLLLALALTLAGFLPQAHAQLAMPTWLTDLAESPRTIGPRLGGNFSTLIGDTYSGLGLRNTLMLGGFMKTELNDKFSLQAEMNISLEGARNRNLDFSELSTVVYDQKLIYNYLQFPLLVKYSLDNGLILSTGLQAGLKLKAREQRIIRSGEPSPSDNSAGSRNITSRIKALYPSIVMGAEYPIPWLEGLNAQARFQTSIFDNVRRFAGDSEGTYPLLFQVALSYDLYEMIP